MFTLPLDINSTGQSYVAQTVPPLEVVLSECGGFRVSRILHLVPLVFSPSQSGVSCVVCLSHLAP